VDISFSALFGAHDFPVDSRNFGWNSAIHLTVEQFHDFGAALIPPHFCSGYLFAVLGYQRIGKMGIGVRPLLVVVHSVGGLWIIRVCAGPQFRDAQQLHHP